jgi:hypothetical protein
LTRVFCFACIVLACVRECQCQTQTALAELEKVKLLTQNRIEQIETLRVSGFKYSAFFDSNEELSQEIFRKICLAIVPTSNFEFSSTEDLAVISNAAFKNVLPERLVSRKWSKTAIFQDGLNVRNEEGEEDSLFLLIKRGNQEHHYKPKRSVDGGLVLGQASVYPNGSSVMIENKGTFFPNLSKINPLKEWKTFSEGGLKTLEVQLENSMANIVFTQSDYTIRSHAVGQSQTKLSREVIFGNAIVESNGVKVPRVVIRSFHTTSVGSMRSVIKAFNVLICTSIEVNGTLDDALFQLSVPENTRVLKFDDGTPFEKGGSRPRGEIVSKPVVDVEEYVSRKEFGGPPGKQSPGSHSILPQIIFLILTMAGLVVCCFFLLRKRRL